MEANWDRSNKWAASTAATMAPSSADKSHISSVTRNLRARLKKAAGPLLALTAMTCLCDCSVVALVVVVAVVVGNAVVVVEAAADGAVVVVPLRLLDAY